MSKFGTTVVFNHYMMIGERQAKMMLEVLEKIMIQAKQEAMDLVRVDTTTLQKSIAIRKLRVGIFELYTNIEYAVYQEYGFTHVNGNFVYPQPFMGPAGVNAAGKIQAAVGAILAMDFG